MGTYPTPDERIPLDSVGVHGQGKDLAIVSYGNGYYLSRQAQEVLKAEGINARVIDMRWIAPVPEQALLDATRGCKSVLIVDECRRTGGQAEGLMALFVERAELPVSRLAAKDSFIATGPAYAATMPSRDAIVAAAREACE
jgi:2-oxoisovalerate dehydrogenase E1 component